MADRKDKPKCQDPACSCPDCGTKKSKGSEGGKE